MNGGLDMFTKEELLVIEDALKIIFKERNAHSIELAFL